jgi:hypothetical protein
MINIMEKPNVKPIALYRVKSFAFPALKSLIAEPVKYDTYAGMSGSTQGDRNDNRPAEKASTIEISFNITTSIFTLHKSYAHYTNKYILRKVNISSKCFVLSD